ncbi:MAG: ATP-dependent DNA helicase RecG [bacterium]
MNIFSSIQYLKGVGPQKTKLLNKISIHTVLDLLYYFPVDWDDRTKIIDIINILPNEKAIITGKIILLREKKIKNNLGILEILVEDKTGRIFLNMFKVTNIKYDVFATLKEKLKINERIICIGKPEFFANEMKLNVIEIEVLNDATVTLLNINRIVPVYNLTEGIDIHFFRKIVYDCLQKFIYEITETLPEYIIKQLQLQNLHTTLKNIHFPDSIESKNLAYFRLVFEEFFYYELALFKSKKSIEQIKKKHKYEIKKTLLSKFKNNLQFEFTAAQKRVINEIFKDMQLQKPMNRLLQGDVGSGKTIVALSAIILAIENNYQTAILVPTEILASQHFNTIKSLISGMDINIGLLIGGSGKKEKQTILSNLAEGKINLLIGTHAILEENIKFNNLKFIVIDEQHKFGVYQRMKLISKGDIPDILIMTATPIPRTLAMTVYSDLDISCLDELPFQKKITSIFLKEFEAYEFLRNKLKENNQAYIVYPLIEESEKIDAAACKVMYEKFKTDIFPEFSIALLHGRLKNTEKEKIINDFKNKKTDILVSTSVVEVGIDVPDASLLLIENYERFGLTTLHQIRGRIGRKGQQAYCLFTGHAYTPEAKKRLSIMLSTIDGFKISEEDLSMRGPGEILGSYQHGMPDFKIGNILKDRHIINFSRNLSSEVINEDYNLYSEKNKIIKKEFYRRFKNRIQFVGVG